MTAQPIMPGLDPGDASEPSHAAAAGSGPRHQTPVEGETPFANDVTQGYSYRAFISYSHAADAKFAPILQAALERLGKPWYRRRALMVFRDDTDLAINPQLWPKIESSMASAEYLLLLACPGAAESAGVKRELRYWTEVLKRKPSTILVALTGGRIAWDAKAQNIDWEQTSALPVELKEYFLNGPEPLWADFVSSATRTDLSLDDPVFRRAAVKVAAALHGIPPRDLEGEDLRQHRKTIRTFGAFVAALVLSLVVVALLLVDVRHQRNEAERRARIAQSRALAVQSMDRSDKQGDLALLLSVESHLAADTLESRKAMLNNLLANPYLHRFLEGTDTANALAFHPTEPRLAAASKDSLWVWSLSSGQHLINLGQRGETYEVLRFFDSGRQLAALTSAGSLALWDFAAAKRTGTLAPSQASDASGPWAYRHDAMVVTTTDAGAVVWDVRQRSVRTIPAEAGDRLFRAEVSPKGDIVAVASRRGLRVWDLAKNAYRSTTFEGHSGMVWALAFSPDGRQLASGSQDESVILWDVETGAIRRRWLRQEWIMTLRFSPNGRFIAWASNHLFVFDLKDDTFVPTRQLRFEDGITTLEFGPDSRNLVVNARSGPLFEIDLMSESRLATIRPAHADWITNVTFSPKGDVLASSSRDGELVLWDAPRKLPMSRSRTEHGIGCLGFSPDGTTLVTCGGEGGAFTWQVRDGTAELRGPLAEKNRKVTAVAFPSERPGIVAGDEAGEVLWSDSVTPGLASFRRIAALGSRVHSIALSPKDDVIAIGCGDGKIHVLDARGKTLHVLQFDQNGVSGLDFSSEGDRLFSASHDSVVSWDVASGRRLGPSLSLRGSAAQSFTLSRAGKLVASGSRMGSIGLWDTGTGALHGQFQSQGRSFFSMALSPNGKLLVAGSGYDGPGQDALVFWDLESEHWQRLACDIAGRGYLTPEEWRRYMVDGRPRATCPTAGSN